MSPRLVPRLIAPAVLIALLAASGCAARPGATGPAPTSTAEATPTPAPTTASPSPDPAPAVPESEATTPPTGGDYGAFTREQLAQTCIDATVSTFAADVRFDIANTRIERRAVSPEWLVIVPARTGGIDAHSLCTIGGTPSAPVMELSSGSLSELPEEQVQRLIRGENEGGDR